MRFGEVSELLLTRPEPGSEQAPGPEREQGLDQLIAAAGRIGEGVHERVQSTQAVGGGDREHDDQR